MSQTPAVNPIKSSRAKKQLGNIVKATLSNSSSPKVDLPSLNSFKGGVQSPTNNGASFTTRHLLVEGSPNNDIINLAR